MCLCLWWSGLLWKSWYRCVCRVPECISSISPHLGKSYSLVYFMLRRMATEQPTLLTTTAGTAYLVDEGGVWRADDGLTEDHIPPSFEKIPFNKRIWSLIDCSSEPSAALTKSSHVFPVHMTSATDVQPLRWCQQNSALKWIMNPWDNSDELIARLVHQRVTLYIFNSELDVACCYQTSSRS